MRFSPSLPPFLRVLLVGLCCGAGWGRAAEAVDVPTSVTRGSLRGVLVPVANVQLSVHGSGVIEKFGAEEGQQVAKDQLLVQLNADVEKADLMRAEAVLESAKSDLDRTNRELTRTKDLLEKNNIGSKKDLEDATAAYQISVGRRKQAEAEVALAEAHLKERSITATFDGLLFRRTHAVGEAVQPLEPVIRLIDASKLELVVYGGADLLGRFKSGQEVRILLESGPGRGTTVTGRVSYVDPTMDPETSTFRVKIQVEPSDKVQSGISVTLQLPSEVN